MGQSGTVEPGTAYTVTVQTEGVRLDRFITEEFPSYSRSFFKELIETNGVLVNGHVASKAGTILKKGATVCINFPAPRERLIKDKALLDPLGIELLFQHPDFLILYKPAGVLVHPPTHKSDTPCLTDWLLASFEQLRQVGHIDRPGIVHRLDKDTSGLMLVALTQQSHRELSDLFRMRTIEKTYKAVVKGHPAQEGCIDLPIGRSPVNRNRMAHNARGRVSQTAYTVVDYFEDSSLVEVKPVTGRTHQIRVHFATQGHPLIGDTLYGTVSKQIKRHALHAYRLAFTYKDTHYSFAKEAPADFNALVTQLRSAEK